MRDDKVLQLTGRRRRNLDQPDPIGFGRRWTARQAWSALASVTQLPTAAQEPIDSADGRPGRLGRPSPWDRALAGAWGRATPRPRPVRERRGAGRRREAAAGATDAGSSQINER
jgi:hypothetical protein